MTLPEAIASVREDLMAAWLKTLDPGARERLWALAHTLELIERKIEAKLDGST